MTRPHPWLGLIAGALFLACGGEEGPSGPMVPTLELVTTALEHAAPTVDYFTTLEAAGGTAPYRWSITNGGLPAGFVLSEGVGVIAGRTTDSGSFGFTLQVTSADGQTASRVLTLEVDPLCTELPASEVITFEDANLAAAVRTQLGLGSSDDVTCAHALGLVVLYALDSGVESLLGIQHFVNLEGLYVRDNEITDITPVSGLTKLQILVAGANRIADISSLGDLSVQLWDLDAGDNPIADISGLASLTGMTKLYLNATSVTDIGPLLPMVEMGDLDLNDNPQLTDIQALIDNAGVNAGDQVHLENTGVACADIAVLEARGVNVISDCS